MITNNEARRIRNLEELTTLRLSAYEELQHNTLEIKGKCADAMKVVSFVGNLSDLLGIVLKSFAWFNNVKWGLRLFSFLKKRK